MSIVSEQVIQNYEAEVAHLTERVGSLAADLLEEQAQRREVGEALVRVTRERDLAQQNAKAVALYAEERQRERDEARDEVVRLSRNPESQTSAFREERETLNAELVRLRTIIVELGAGEAAEPQEEIEALRPEGEL